MPHLRAAVAIILLLLTVQGAAAQGMMGVAERAVSSSSSQDGSPGGSATDTSDARLESLIRQARESGTPFIVMPIDEAGGAAGSTAAGGSSDPIDQALLVRNAMRNTLAALPHAGSDIVETLKAAGGDTGMVWFVYGALLAALSLAVGFVVRIAIARWGRRRIRRLDIDPAKDRVYLVSLVLLRLGVSFLSLAGFVIAGFITTTIIAPQTGSIGWTAHVALLSVALYLLAHDIFATLFSPDEPRARMPNLEDRDAHVMLRRLLVIFAISITALGISVWLVGLGLDARVGHLIRMGSSIFVAVLLSVYAIAYRAEVARMFRGFAPDPPGWRKIVAAVWHLVFVAYLVVATAISLQTLAMGEGFRAGPIAAPILGALAGFIAYGLAIIIIDRRVRARQEALYLASHGTARGVGPEGVAQEIPAPAPAQGEDVVEPVTRWQLRWKGFADKVAGMSALVVAIVVMAAVSNNLKLHTEAGEWVGIAVILYITFVLYQALKTWIDGRIEEEEGPAVVDSEDGMGPGASRLATLLPLLRNVLIVCIFAIVGTIVLAGLGVNVGPLFAGAGIVGLAVGFGAQSLIRDIFSGAFFLADDAFRRGEYIDVGGVMGSVEKISVRSFQLRHHNGPLHTIPFGEIKQLTNFSRDWVIMKLKLRLVYGTDIEHVRKLIKKLGQELLADPEIGHLFMDPLKSQGVVEMEDSAMICRVKFMTKPGDQFLARRHVYARIHELFEREHIQFASRQVTVRVEGAQPGDSISPAVGAVQPVIQDNP